MAGVTFLPIQAGTGDPSPSNVRPISPGLTITGIGDIYGGYLDVAHGTVVETWGYTDIGEAYWNASGSTPGGFYSGSVGTIIPYKISSGTQMLCTSYAVVGPASANNYYGSDLTLRFYATGSYRELYIVDTDYSSAYAFNNHVHGVMLAYELATPITHALTSAQLAEAMRKLGVESPSMLARRRRLVMAQPHLASATPANPVSFAATLAAPLKALECAFSPVQAAGTPAPDNVLPISGWTGANVVRCGTNIWDEQWELGYFDTTTGAEQAGTNTIRSKNYIGIRPQTEYRFINGGTDVYVCIVYYDRTKQVLSVISGASGGIKNNVIFTTPLGAYYMRFYMSVLYGSTYGNNIAVNYPATDTEYHPYTGQTLAVAFPATKNLFDIGRLTPFNSNVTLTKSGGDFTITNNNGYAVGIFRGASGDIVFPVTDGKYTMSITEPTTVGIGIYASTDGENYSWFNNGILAGNTSATFTVSGQKYIKLVSSVGSGKTATIKGFQLELGSTATTYEPYGTIYGGYIDPVRGVARAEWGAVDLGSLSWSIFQSTQSGLSFFYAALSNGAANVTGGREAYCASYKRYAPNSDNWWMSTPDKQFISQASGVSGTPRVWIRDDTYTDKDSFKTAVSGVMLVYKLATPIEYPITPAVLKTLKGANVIYTDLNGNITPTYWTH